MTNERHNKDLAELLKAARAIPGSSARQKAVSAMTEAAAAGSRRRSLVSWRRAAPAAAFIVVLVASGFWLLPKRHTVALADVARAMANVQSAHLVGWRIDSTTGERRAFEIWIKGPSKFRSWREGGLDVADDGESVVLVSPSSASLPAIAEIRGSGEPYGVDEGQTYLGLFKATTYVHGLRVREQTRLILPDGRQAVELVLYSPGMLMPGTKVMTVDADTGLLVQWEHYLDDGTLSQKVERIEYDVDIPDSIFSLKIPEDALVFDERWSAPAEVLAKRKAIAEQLKADPDAYLVFDTHTAAGTHSAYATSGGGGYHPGLYIKCVDRDGGIFYYLAEDNKYYVLGRALVYYVTEDAGGFWQVVEDAQFEAPGPPAHSPEELEARRAKPREYEIAPAVRAQREAKAQALLDAGAHCVAQDCRGSCATDYHPGMSFKCLGDDGMWIYYVPDRNVYYIMGKVLVWGADFDEVVEDAEFTAPGEPQQLP